MRTSNNYNNNNYQSTTAANNKSTEAFQNLLPNSFMDDGDESWVDCLADEDVLCELGLDTGTSTEDFRDDSDQFSFTSEDRWTTNMSRFVVEDDHHSKFKHGVAAMPADLGETFNPHPVSACPANKKRKVGATSRISLSKPQQQQQYFFQLCKLLGQQDTAGISTFFHKNADHDVVVVFRSRDPSSPFHYVEVSGVNAAISFLDKAFLSFPDGVFHLTSTAQLCAKKSGSAVIRGTFCFQGTKVINMVNDQADVMIISNPLHLLNHKPSIEAEEDVDEMEEGEIAASKPATPTKVSKSDHRDTTVVVVHPPDDDLLALTIDPVTKKVSTKSPPIVDILQGVNEHPHLITSTGTLTMSIGQYLKIARIEFEY